MREGIRTIDVDLTPVTFCDCSGLNAFLDAAHRTIAANGSLRLHHPPTTLTRILTLTGTGPLLLGPTSGHVFSPAEPYCGYWSFRSASGARRRRTAWRTTRTPSGPVEQTEWTPG
ncbi:STAS domain-containing protein [Streptomyces netropsis]